MVVAERGSPCTPTVSAWTLNAALTVQQCSLCSCCRTGVNRCELQRRVSGTRRAAAFCTHWRRWSKSSMTLYTRANCGSAEGIWWSLRNVRRLTATWNRPQLAKMEVAKNIDLQAVDRGDLICYRLSNAEVARSVNDADCWRDAHLPDVNSTQHTVKLKLWAYFFTRCILIQGKRRLRLKNYFPYSTPCVFNASVECLNVRIL